MHLAVKFVVKYATAGFVMYGAPIYQVSFWAMKTGIRRGGPRNSQMPDYIHWRGLVIFILF